MIPRILLALSVAALLTSACARSDRSGGDCAPEPAALDRVERVLTACVADPDCPCGSRCEGNVCTYDCRRDRADMPCPPDQICTASGACEPPNR